MEIWKDINGFEGLYMISNLGRVKSLAKLVNNRFGQRLTNERILVSTNNGHGYFMIGLSRNRKVINHYIHRLIAEAFIPNPDNKPQVNHINGIKSDNYLTNLEWVSGLENTRHAIDTGLTNRNGENNVLAKITEIQVKEIKELNHKLSQKKIGELYGLSQTHISRIIRGERWKHLL